MSILLVKKKIESIDKLYFTTFDLAEIIKQTGSVLRVTVHRLVQKGILLRIHRGIYILPEKAKNLDQIVGQLYFPCYLSFESALARWGILNQIPYTLTYASLNKSKHFYIGQFTIEIKMLKQNLFWGYQQNQGLYIATPEKALLDQLYFVSLGKAKLDFDELNLHEVSKTKILAWSRRFPKRTQGKVKELITRFGKISVTIQ